MTLNELYRAAKTALEPVTEDPTFEAACLLEHFCGANRTELLLHGDKPAESEAEQAVLSALEKRKTGEPLQYLLGEWDFMSLTLSCGEGVLIPRADTEILVEKALKVMPPNARVLDIGTGSGAIAVSLARLGQAARVTAVDVSDKALEIARKNAENNGADVEFVKSDCFSALQGRKYDMIVSNPPYISDEEMQTLMPEVRQEPELALFGGGDGLDFYRRISREAPEHLNEGGFLLFEIGWLQKDAVSALMRTFIGEPFALRDYGRNWRVVGAQLKRR